MSCQRCRSSGDQRSNVDSKRCTCAERSLADQLADGEEVPVPAAVLEDHERPFGRSRRCDELLGLGDGRREGLVDDEGGSGGERRQALLEVHVGGRGEHDEVEALREQFLGRPDDLGSGMILGGLRPAGRVARRDGLDREARVRPR